MKRLVLALSTLAPLSCGDNPEPVETPTGQNGPAGKADGAAAAHVQIVDGQLLVDGEPTFLYGGEIHYFRVRDENFDAERTYEMWEETLDAMQDAGMNLVTTYAPWDYHQLGPDTWDFSGARDVGRFIQMACDRGMYVVYKPGPLITAEWPRGFGTFGAVPAWWKEAHPEALMRKADGDFYNYSPFGDVDQRQPTYLHPTFLEATRTWYEKSLEVVRPHIGGCLVGLQLDNETNMYWSDRYGDVDYSETSIDHYRQWLADKYGTIDALNEVYGSAYASFEDVEPPSKGPGPLSGRDDNAKMADWYWAGQAYIGDYLGILREMFSELGFNEPDVMIHTNDSPFTLLLEDVQLRDVMIHDGPTKNEAGMGTLDLYPKQMPTNDALADQPFQADYFTRLYDHYADSYTGAQGYIYGAELQGGFYRYKFPLVGEVPGLGDVQVRPEATDQLMARTIGRGLKGGAFYVYRDGLNADNSRYDYQAAIAADGTRTDRYDVTARWGRMLAREGADLMRAEEVTDRVAILNNGLYAAPAGGLLDNMQRFYSIEYPALFGWLVHSGINPEVVDTRLVDADDLSGYDVVFYPNPDYLDADTAELLEDYVSGGGVLVNIGWPGRLDTSFRPAPEVDSFASLFPGEEDGFWTWPSAGRSGGFNVEGTDGAAMLRSFWYQSYWDVSDVDQTATQIEPIAWERRAITGRDGAVVGYVARDERGTRVHLGTNVYSRFNRPGYYDWDEDELQGTRDLARRLVGLGGVQPLVSASAPHELAWARRTGDKLYIFVVNDADEQRDIQVRLADDTRLGLGSSLYEVREALDDRPLGDFSGAQLVGGGLSVGVPAWSTAVIVIEPGQ